MAQNKPARYSGRTGTFVKKIIEKDPQRLRKAAPVISHMAKQDAESFQLSIEKGEFKNISVIYRPHPWGGGGNQGDRIFEEKWQHVQIEDTMKKYMEGIKKKGYHLTYPDCTDTHVVLSYCDCIISPLSTILIVNFIYNIENI